MQKCGKCRIFTKSGDEVEGSSCRVQLRDRYEEEDGRKQGVMNG